MSQITIGIEIEYRDLNRKIVDDYLSKHHPRWTNKIEDAILKDAKDIQLGGEIVSPILKDNANTWQELAEICDFLNKNYASSKNTGAHIHIGANVFEDNPKYLLRFIKLWCSYEHIIYYFCYGETSYARDTLDIYSPPVGNEYKYLLKTLNLSSEDSFTYLITVLNLGKKRGLNLSNINRDQRKNTIEFRCPNGTFNPHIWYNNFLLFKRMLEYSKSKNYNENLLNKKLLESHDIHEDLDLEDALELANIIYLSEKEKLSFLKQCLKGSNKQQLKK